MWTCSNFSYKKAAFKLARYCFANGTSMLLKVLPVFLLAFEPEIAYHCRLICIP